MTVKCLGHVTVSLVVFVSSFITSQPGFPHLGKEGKKGLVLGNGWNVLWEAVIKSPEH